MNLELQGKTALVTGSSRGIGRAIAQILHDEGCNLMLNGRSEAPLREAAASFGDRGAFLACDATSAAASAELVAATVQRWGALDLLVCNIGNGQSARPGDESAAEWERMVAINLSTATNMVNAAQKPLAAARGAIVCISSICGIEVVPGAPVTYSAAKAALNAYVRGMARPLGAQGIRINAVAPGNIVFAGSVWERKLAADRAAVESMLQRDVALGRLGRDTEVAHAVAFLASPKAGFITGAVIVIDGGQARS